MLDFNKDTVFAEMHFSGLPVEEVREKGHTILIHMSENFPNKKVVCLLVTEKAVSKDG